MKKVNKIYFLFIVPVICKRYKKRSKKETSSDFATTGFLNNYLFDYNYILKSISNPTARVKPYVNAAASDIESISFTEV